MHETEFRQVVAFEIEQLISYIGSYIQDHILLEQFWILDMEIDISPSK